MADEVRASGAARRGRPYRSAVLAVVLAALAGGGATFAVFHWEQAAVRFEFQQLAERRAAELQRALDAIATAVDTLGALLTVPQAGYDEFYALAAQIQARHACVRALAWAPRIDDGQGGERFPVQLVGPSDGDMLRSGADLAADRRWQPVLTQAREAGAMVVTGRVDLDRAAAPEPGFWIVRPVVAARGDGQGRAVSGFVVGVVQIAELVRDALNGLPPGGIDFFLYDEIAPAAERFLYYHASRTRGREGGAQAPRTPPASLAQWRTALLLPGGQRWADLSVPAPAFAARHSYWRSWTTAGVAAAGTALLGAYLVVAARRRVELARLARHLAKGSRALRGEIVRARQRAAAPRAKALEQAGDAVLITDAAGRIEYVNSAFEAMTGYRSAEVIGKAPGVVKSGRHDQAYYQAMWGTLLKGEIFRDVLINRKKDGTLYYEEKTITPLKDAQGKITHFMAAGREITERIRDQKRLHHLAYHDILTELPNRMLFMDRLKHALARRRKPGSRAAVLFLDADGFKEVNDAYGHTFGDRLLQLVAGRITACVREGDTVARIGGDEFAILLEEVESAADVSPIAQKIVDASARPFMLDDHDVVVTSSIGISLFPDDGREADTLLQHADTAMYRAKQQGRNSYRFFSAAVGPPAAPRPAPVEQMRRAIERSELLLFYQPQIDLSSGQAVGFGVEALLRWRHPDLGMLPAGEFLAGLEEAGDDQVILDLGEWVLRAACSQARAWRDLGVEARVSVNLSGRQLRAPSLPGQVAKALRDSGVRPDMLELEVSERALLQDDAVVLQNLAALHRTGVHLAIDDFGAALPAPGYLKRTLVDTLKIDMPFVRDLTRDREGAGIVTATIAMARTLGIDVVAEGVETVEQMELLRSFGCQAMQGHLFGRPLPADEMTRVLVA